MSQGFASCREGTRATRDIAVHPHTGDVDLATRDEVLRLRDTRGTGKADVRERLVFLDTKGDYPHNGLSGLCFDSRGGLLFGMGENLGVSYTLKGADGTTLHGGEGGNVFRCWADGSAFAASPPASGTPSASAATSVAGSSPWTTTPTRCRNAKLRVRAACLTALIDHGDRRLDLRAVAENENGQHLPGSEKACQRHVRAWALLHNFRPWHPATARANGGWRCPAERLNQHRYHAGGLQNLLTQASLNGFRRRSAPQTPCRSGFF